MPLNRTPLIQSNTSTVVDNNLLNLYENAINDLKVFTNENGLTIKQTVLQANERKAHPYNYFTPDFIQIDRDNVKVTTEKPVIVSYGTGLNEKGENSNFSVYSSEQTLSLPAGTSLNYLYSKKSGDLDSLVLEKEPYYYATEFRTEDGIDTSVGITTSGSDIADRYNNEFNSSGSAASGTISAQPVFGSGMYWFNETSASLLSSALSLGSNWTIDFYFQSHMNQKNVALINTRPYFGMVFGTLSGKLAIYLSSNGSSWNIANGVTGSKQNFKHATWYQVRLRFTGTQYLVQIAEQNDDRSFPALTTEIIVNSSIAITTLTNLELGSNATNAFSGGVTLFDEFRLSNISRSDSPGVSGYSVDGNTQSLLKFNDAMYTQNPVDSVGGVTWALQRTTASGIKLRGGTNSNSSIFVSSGERFQTQSQPNEVFYAFNKPWTLEFCFQYLQGNSRFQTVVFFRPQEDAIIGSSIGFYIQNNKIYTEVSKYVNSDIASQFGTSTMSPGRWYKYVMQYDGRRTYEGFLSTLQPNETWSLGVLEHRFYSSLVPQTASKLELGNNTVNPTQFFEGYICDIQFKPGNISYNYGFNVKTVRTSDVNTLALANFEQTNGTTVPTDAVAGQNWTYQGTSGSYIANLTPKFGSKFLSVCRNGSGDGFGTSLYCQQVLSFGSSHTLEGWFSFANTDIIQYLFVNNGGSSVACDLRLSAAKRLELLYQSAGVSAQSAVLTVNNNQWYHIALVRTPRNIDVFFDGVLALSLQISTYIPIATAGEFGWFGGKLANAGSTFFTGQVQELRISNIARYTSNFTPPVASYVLDSNTWSLIKFQNQKNQGYIVDEVADRVWTLSQPSRTTLKTSLGRFGSASYNLRSAAGLRSSVTSTPANYTAEMYFKLDYLNDGTNQVLISRSTSFNTTVAFIGGTTQKLSLYLGNGSAWTIANNVQGSFSDWEVNRWYHLALTFDGSNYRVYIDGKRDILVNSSSTTPSSVNWTIGYEGSFFFPVRMYVDNFRLSNVVRYSDGITVGTPNPVNVYWYNPRTNKTLYGNPSSWTEVNVVPLADVYSSHDYQDVQQYALRGFFDTGEFQVDQENKYIFKHNIGTTNLIVNKQIRQNNGYQYNNNGFYFDQGANSLIGGAVTLDEKEIVYDLASSAASDRPLNRNGMGTKSAGYNGIFTSARARIVLQRSI